MKTMNLRYIFRAIETNSIVVVTIASDLRADKSAQRKLIKEFKSKVNP